MFKDGIGSRLINQLASVNQSSATNYQYSYLPNVNVSEKIQQMGQKIYSDKLDDIISSTFENLDNQQYASTTQYPCYEKQKKQLDFESINYGHKGQLRNRIFFNIENETQSIVNSSNKDSFQKHKQRVPGKLTQSQDSLPKDQLKKSSESDYYYNFTIKNSTFNSQYLFNEPEHRSDRQLETYNYSSLRQNEHYQDNKPYDVQISKQKPEYNPYRLHIERINQPISNRTGFIRQNKLNSKSKTKPKNMNGSQSSLQSTKNPKLISQHEQFQVHYNKQLNSRYHQPNQNQILDQDFWRKVDQHKSTSESLKQTFDSQKIHNYQINSLLNHNFNSTKNTRSNYSQIGHKNRFNDSVCQSQQVNPHIKEYENDLFEFIKKELINTTFEKKEKSQKQRIIQGQYNAQKMKNVSLYHLYQRTKIQLENQLNHEQHSIQSIQTQIKLLQEQILFYKEHSISIEQSIAVKIKKQQDFYFKHKANLQEIILSNNQQIADLKNQLFKVQNPQKATDSARNQVLGSAYHENNSLNSSKSENRRLKDELRRQSLLYENSVKKLTNNHERIHELQKKKAEQIKGLVEEFENVKQLIRQAN